MPGKPGYKTPEGGKRMHVLIFTGQFGMGHIAAAQAVQEEILRQEPTASVTVLQKALRIVNVTGIFRSLTVILAGIHPEIAIIMGMIFTCLLLLIPKVTCPFFHCSIRLPSMIPMNFCSTFSE